MKVKCINGDFSNSESITVKAILTVGDDHLLPKEGHEYEIIGYYHRGGKEGYELAEIDTTKFGYNAKLCFNKERFVISDDTFVPNAMLEDWVGFGSGLCRKVNFYMEIPNIVNLKGDYKYEPRKD